MTVLVIRRSAHITEDYSVVARVGTAVTDLALRREDRFGGSSPLDAGCRFGNCRHKGNGLVHVATGLRPRG